MELLLLYVHATHLRLAFQVGFVKMFKGVPWQECQMDFIDKAAGCSQCCSLCSALAPLLLNQPVKRDDDFEKKYTKVQTVIIKNMLQGGNGRGSPFVSNQTLKALDPWYNTEGNQMPARYDDFFGLSRLALFDLKSKGRFRIPFEEVWIGDVDHGSAVILGQALWTILNQVRELAQKGDKRVVDLLADRQGDEKLEGCTHSDVGVYVQEDEATWQDWLLFGGICLLASLGLVVIYFMAN